MKRGQSTVFTIIAILIILIAFLVTYLKMSAPTQEVRKAAIYPASVEAFRNVIKSCTEQTANEGLIVIGLQGGFYKTPPNKLDFGPASVSYWLLDGRRSQPPLQHIQNELNIYIEENLNTCIEFSRFRDLKFARGQTNAATRISDSVQVTVTYPITVTKDSTNYNLKEPYIVNIPVRLNKIYETASGVVNKTIEDPNYINIGYLLERDLDVEVTELGDQGTIYTMYDKKSKVNDLPYLFMFMVN